MTKKELEARVSELEGILLDIIEGEIKKKSNDYRTDANLLAIYETLMDFAEKLGLDRHEFASSFKKREAKILDGLIGGLEKRDQNLAGLVDDRPISEIEDLTDDEDQEGGRK